MMSFVKASLLIFLLILTLIYLRAHLFSNRLDRRVPTLGNSCSDTTNRYICNPTALKGGLCCLSSSFYSIIYMSLTLY
jgi:hypothetical protein